MATTQSIVKGSTIRINLNVDGLGEYHLSDNNVGVSTEFYIKGSYTTGNKVTVGKADMVKEETGESNDLTCVVDTSSLTLGSLMALVTVSYPSSTEEGKPTVTEKDVVDCNITLIEPK